MPSPFYPRHPKRALRVLPAALAALSLGLPQAVLAENVVININTPGPVHGNSSGNWNTPLPGDATSNSVTVNSPYTVTGDVYGGYSDFGVVTNNSVTISGGGTVTGDVYGGYSDFGVVTNNSVTVSGGGTVNGKVYGGESRFNLATGNSVTISWGRVTDNVYGGDSIDSIVTGNSVTVSGGAVSGGVYGGNSQGSTATDNAVTVSGGAVSGGVYGGNSQGGTATDNAVTVSGGTVVGSVHGGWSDSGAATGNSVTVSSGHVEQNVYGGYSGGEDAMQNTVTLSGGSIKGSVYGGQAFPGRDGFTGNTLNVTASGLTVGGLTNFQYLNFYLPSTLAADGTMLTVKGTANLTDGGNESSVVNVGIAGSSSRLSAGDKITLIEASTLTTASGLNSTANGTGMQGVTLEYTFALAATATALTATVTSGGARARGESKALPEGVLSSAALVNRGGDMAADETMAQAVSAGSGGGMGGGFGAVSGGKARYNSGSHSDVSSVSLATGFAKGFELDQGQAVLGAFLEYGNGSYDAYNSFATGRTHGKGDMDYVGVGMLGRMDFAPEGPGHAYTEASLRLGRTHNKYDNADLGGGIGAHYKTSPAYYGGHVGAGYVWDIAPKTALDLSAKYLVTHQNASRVTLGSGDDIRFDSVTSKRTRLGGRVFYAATDRISPYAGAAWEYEFDAKADATTSGVAIDAPSLKGGTGIGELGVAVKPSAELPLSLDLGLQGYAGKREGVTGSLKAVFRF